MRFKLKIRQHSQFFNRPWRQVLRFVDNQQTALTVASDRYQIGFKQQQQIRLVGLLGRNPERGRYHAKRVIRIQLGAHQMCCNHLIGIQLTEKIPNKRRFAGPDFTGDYDETFILMQPVLEVGHRAPMLTAAIIKRWIGIELKRLATQPVE